MRVLVTGGAGKIGRRVVAGLVATGYTVLASDRVAATFPGARVEQADLLDPAVLAHLVRGQDAVVHLANHPHAGARADASLLTENTTMNMHLFQAAADAGVRQVIYASSIETISGSGGAPHRQPVPAKLPALPVGGHTPVHPGNPYALSKVLGEQMLAYFGAYQGAYAATTLRLPSVLLADHPVRWVPPLAEAMAYLPSEELAWLISLLLERPLPGYRCYLPSGLIQLEEAEWVRVLTGPYAPACWREKQPVEELARACVRRGGLVDLEPLAQEVGWSPACPPLILSRPELAYCLAEECQSARSGASPGAKTGG